MARTPPSGLLARRVRIARPSLRKNAYPRGRSPCAPRSRTAEPRHNRVALGGRPPRAPTDPYVRDYRIRFLCYDFATRQDDPSLFRGHVHKVRCPCHVSLRRFVTGAPLRFFLPSIGSPRVGLPRLLRYYEGAMTSRRSSLRTSLPSLGGSSVALDDSLPPRAVPRGGPGLRHPVVQPGYCRTNGGISHVPEQPPCTFALLSDPGWTGCARPLRHTSAVPASHHGKDSHRKVSFEAQSHGFNARCGHRA
jgi:hypothetical protein